MAEADEDNKEIEKITSDAKRMLSKAFSDINKSSSTKQLLIGVASGWTTGYLTIKISKTAAFAIGGGIIILQVAQNQGYIKIDWDRIKKNAIKTTESIENKYGDKAPTWIEQARQFFRKNSCFAGGFLGGFFIGLAA